MKKFAKTLVFIVLCVCIAFTIAACGNKGGNADFSYAEEYETNGITLGRYEELDLLPVEGGAEGITITSANPSIVSVIGNRLIAESEGQTTITATRKKSKKTLTVRVYDDGAKLSLGADNDIAYIGSATDLGFHVVFNKKDYAYGATYKLTIPAEYASIAEVRNGKLYGKAEGTIKVKASIENYKGVDVIRGEFTVRVCPASFVDVKSAELSVYNAKDSKLAKAKIEPTVHYNAAKIADAAVVYEVTDGADKIEIDDEGNIVGKAEGVATVKVKYGADETVFTEVTVTVKPNYIGTSFFASGVGDEIKQSYKPYEGEAEIGGRKEGIFEYTQGDGADWDSRMSYAEAGDSIVNNARKGYKYFGYDLYLGGSQIYIGLDHADCQWFGAGAYLRTDYMQVVDCETGAITNRLERNKWIRIVYDLDYYINNSSYVAFAETGFFYTQSGTPGSHSYIDNVRWYLDDEYYDHDAEANVKYTLNDDGTISATNNEWTFDDTVNVYNGEYVETESTYAPAEGEIGGVSGAWKYAPVTVTRLDKDDPSKTKTVFSSWENQLKLVSATAYKNGSTGDNGYNVNGMRNLTEGIAKKVGAPVNDSVESKYKFVTFDLYVENGDSFNLNLNHVNIGGKINLGTTMAEEGYVDGGTDLSTKSSYLRAWKKGSDKLAYYIEKGNWYTVCLAYFDNYDASAWSCNILFSGDGGNVYYINDVKFHKSMDGVAPAEYAGLKPVSGLSMLDNTKANGQTLSWVYEDEVAEKGEEFAGALKFKTNYAGTDAWSNSRLGFDGIAVNSSFFKDGMKYIVTDVYFDENVESLGALTWVTHGSLGLSGKKYTGSIKLGETTEMYLYENGARVKGNVEANKWYKLVMPVDYPAQQQWAVASVEIKAKDASVAAYAYFNNITYTKDIPYECKDVVIADKPASIAWKDMAGDNTAETKTYDLSYIATPGLEVTWRSSDEDVATVSGGTITFKRGQWGKAVTITASAVVSEDVTITDSFTVTLTNNVTELSTASDKISYVYGTDDEADVIYLTSTATTDSWSNSAAFSSIVSWKTPDNDYCKPVDSFRTHGYKWVSLDICFDANAKVFEDCIWLNSDGSNKHSVKFDMSSSDIPANAYFYNIEADGTKTKARGKVIAGKWYTVLMAVDYSKANPNWAKAFVGLTAKTEDGTTAKIANLKFLTEMPAVYDLTISNKPSRVLWRELGDNKQITINTVATAGYDVEWNSSDPTVATVSDAGVLTFLSTGFNKSTTITASMKITDTFTLTDSFTVQLVDAPSNLVPNENVSLYYGTDDEIIVKTTMSEGYSSTVGLYDISKGSSPVASWRNNGYKYLAMDILFGENSKGIRSVIWLNNGQAHDEQPLLVGEAVPSVNITVFDAATKAKIYGNVEANKWYTIYIATNYSNPNPNWSQAYLNVWSNADGVEGTIKIKNVTPVTAITGTYDLRMTGKPTADVNYRELTNGELQLGVNATEGLELVWEIDNADYATVDGTGKVTLKGSAIGNNVTVTVYGKLNGSVVISDSVTFGVTAVYSVEITNKPASLDWADLASGRTFALETSAATELTLVWSVDETDYASVNNGVVTFTEAAIGNEVTVTVKGMLDGAELATDSVTFTLTHEMRHFKANDGLSSLAYGTGDDIDVVLATATKTGSNDSWNSSVLFSDLIEAGTVNRPSLAYMNAGYKWVSVELMFDENLQFIRPNFDWQGDAATYYRTTIYPNTTLADNVYAFNMDGVRVSTIIANTWYKFFFPVELADKDKFHTENLCVWANDGTTTVLKLRNFACSTAKTGVYDKLVVTGGTNSSVIFTEGGTNTVQLGLANGADVFGGYTWTVDNGEVATVADGLVTFLKTGSVNVTVTPVNTAYASLATTVSLKAVTAEEKKNEWHFDSTLTTWVEDGEFANSWKYTATSEDLLVASPSSDASNANYIMLEFYVAKGCALNYHSNMYRNGKSTWWWSWGTNINANTKYYEMDGTRATKLEAGKWYKAVFLKAKQDAGCNWGDARLGIDKVDNAIEFYYRNVAYGDTIPAGWINE